MYARLAADLSDQLLPRLEQPHWVDVGAASGRKSAAMSWALHGKIRRATLVERNQTLKAPLHSVIERDFPKSMDVQCWNGCISKFNPKDTPHFVTAIHYAYDRNAVGLLFQSPLLRQENIVMITSVEHRSSHTAVMRKEILQPYFGSTTEGYFEELEAAMRERFYQSRAMVVKGKTLDLRGHVINRHHWLLGFLVGPHWHVLQQAPSVCSEVAERVSDYVVNRGSILELTDTVLIGIG